MKLQSGTERALKALDKLNAIVIDLATGERKWTAKFPQQLWGPVLTTAGELVFAGGTNDRYFRAFDANSGEILWKIGLPDEFGTGSQNICTDLGFSFQHHFQKLNNGNFLFFDNGNLSQIVRGTETPTSRIIEFEILNNMECNIICACDLPEPYYSASMGSVNLLDNGKIDIRVINQITNSPHTFPAFGDQPQNLQSSRAICG